MFHTHKKEKLVRKDYNIHQNKNGVSELFDDKMKMLNYPDSWNWSRDLKCFHQNHYIDVNDITFFTGLIFILRST